MRNATKADRFQFGIFSAAVRRMRVALPREAIGNSFRSLLHRVLVSSFGSSIGAEHASRSGIRAARYASAVAIVGGSATAAQTLPKTLTCLYTEPFITTTYVSSKRTLVVERAPGNARTVIRGVIVDTVRPGTLRFRKGRRVLQTVDLTQTGSDGMSDRVFPYAGRLAGENLTGGCK